MSYSILTKKSNIATGEVDWLWVPGNVRTGRYGVILLHGASTPDQFVGQGWPAANKLAAALANAGIPCVSGYLGTNSTNTADPWSNDTHMARITSALAYLASATGASATKAHLFGVSMGGGAAFRYAATNPTKVASVVAVMPQSNISRNYTDDNPAGARAGIGTAWGVTYPTALPAGADLVAQAAAISAAHIPVRAYYSTVDTLALPADVRALANAAGGTHEAIDSTAGHANGSLAKFDVSAYLTFLKEHGA